MRTPVMNRKTLAKDIPLTPIERLLADKHAIEARCILQEKKLQDDYEYIQNNALSLIFSGLTTLLFSLGRARRKPVTQPVALVDKNQSQSNLGIITQNLVPFVWDIVQPLLIKWGIKKVKSWITSLFTKKRYKDKNNES